MYMFLYISSKVFYFAAMEKRSLHTVLSPRLLNLYTLNGAVVVIIDVFRATSTIATALYNGAQRVYPVADVERCKELGRELGIGFVGVALAFGLTVLTGVYAFGHISGGHFNPAVSIGLWAGGRFAGKEVVPYIISQVLGSILGAAILYVIATGKSGFQIGDFASNGYGDHSPGGYNLAACIICEVVMTFMFVIVIMGATHKKASGAFAGVAIGLALTLIHLVSIPVTNTSDFPQVSD